MFSALLRSLPGKVVAVLAALVGLTGGAAATGGLDSIPVLGTVLFTDSTAGAQGVGSSAVGVPLRFPEAALTPAAVEADGGPEAENQDELELLAVKPAEPAAQAAQAALEAAEQAVEECFATVSQQVSAVQGLVPQVVVAAQAEALVAQAQALVAAANTCAGMAAQSGIDGTDRARATVQRIETMVAEIQAIPLQQITDPVLGTVDQVVEKAPGIIDSTSTYPSFFSSLAEMAQAYFKAQNAPSSTPGPTLQTPDETGSSWETAQRFTGWFEKFSSANGGDPDGDRWNRSRNR